MHEQPNRDGGGDENPCLHGHAEEKGIAEREEGFGEIRVCLGAAGEGFGESAEKRERAERDDERREAEARDERGIHTATERAGGDRADGCEPRRKGGVFPQHAEDDRAQAHERADGEVDASGEDDRRHDESEQADFDGLADDVRDVVGGAEIPANGIEEHNLRDEDEEQDSLVSGEQGFPSGGRRSFGHGNLVTPKALGLR